MTNLLRTYWSEFYYVKTKRFETQLEFTTRPVEGDESFFAEDESSGREDLGCADPLVGAHQYFGGFQHLHFLPSVVCCFKTFLSSTQTKQGNKGRSFGRGVQSRGIPILKHHFRFRIWLVAELVYSFMTDAVHGSCPMSKKGARAARLHEQWSLKQQPWIRR